MVYPYNICTCQQVHSQKFYIKSTAFLIAQILYWFTSISYGPATHRHPLLFIVPPEAYAIGSILVDIDTLLREQVTVLVDVV